MHRWMEGPFGLELMVPLCRKSIKYLRFMYLLAGKMKKRIKKESNFIHINNHVFSSKPTGKPDKIKLQNSASLLTQK